MSSFFISYHDTLQNDITVTLNAKRCCNVFDLTLSVIYSIIKAQDGEIIAMHLPAGAAGKEGEGSEFIINLLIA